MEGQTRTAVKYHRAITLNLLLNTLSFILIRSFFFSDDEADSDSDDAASASWSLRLGGVRRASFGMPAASAQRGPHPPALDIGLLKRQYDKLRERQRQAHIILTTTARQTVADSASAATAANALSTPVNQYLLGRNAIVSSKGRRIGPPAGAIPPSRVVSSKPMHPALKAASGLSSASVSSASTAKSGGKPKRGETLQWKEINATRRASDVGVNPSAHSQADPTAVQEEASALNPLNKSPSAASNGSSTSDRSATSVSYRSTSRRRSESSSYSDDSDANSSTSTSLCDEDGGTGSRTRNNSVPSSLEASPMRRPLSHAQVDNRTIVAAEDAAVAKTTSLSAEDTEVLEMLRTAKLDECISELNKQNLCENCDILSCGSEGECAVAVMAPVALVAKEEVEVWNGQANAEDLVVNEIDVSAVVAASSEKLDEVSEKEPVIMDMDISATGIDLTLLGALMAEQHSVPMETIDEQPLAEEIAEILNEEIPEVVFEAIEAISATHSDVNMATESIDIRRTSESFEKYLQLNFPLDLDVDIETDSEMPNSPSSANQTQLNAQSSLPNPSTSSPPPSSPPTVRMTTISPPPPSPKPTITTSLQLNTNVSKLPPSTTVELFTSTALSSTPTSIAAFERFSSPTAPTWQPHSRLAQISPHTIPITSTSQLSPIGDFSKYLSSISSISPLRTPSAVAYLDYSNELSASPVPTVEQPPSAASTSKLGSVSIAASATATTAVEFKVNDEGVTNEYFERVTGAPERPTRLELLSSTSDDAASGGGSFVNDDLTRDIYVNRFVAGELARAVSYVDSLPTAGDDVFDEAAMFGIHASSKEHVFMKEKSISLDEPTRNEGRDAQLEFKPTSCPEAAETPLYTPFKQSDRVSRIIEENSRILHSLLRKNGTTELVQVQITDVTDTDMIRTITPNVSEVIDELVEMPETAIDDILIEKCDINELIDEQVESADSLNEHIFIDHKLEDHISAVASQAVPLANGTEEKLCIATEPNGNKTEEMLVIVTETNETEEKPCIATEPNVDETEDKLSIVTEHIVDTLEFNNAITHQDPSITATDMLISQTSTTTTLSSSLLDLYSATRATASPSITESLKSQSTDISETLSSIKNTIRSIDTLCQKDNAAQRSRDKTVEIIESMNECRYRQAKLTTDDGDADAFCGTGSARYRRHSRLDIRREISPRRQSRCDDQRDEYQSVIKRDRSAMQSGRSVSDLCQMSGDESATQSPPVEQRSSSRYSFPPGSFADFTAPAVRISEHTDAPTNSTSPIGDVYPPVAFGERKLAIRHTTVTSTFYDRFLSQKQENRRSQLNVRLGDRSPTKSFGGDGGVPSVITQDYLNSLRLPSAKTSSTTTLTTEMSPPRRRTDGRLNNEMSGSLTTFSLSAFPLSASSGRGTTASTKTPTASGAAVRDLSAYRTPTFQSCDNIPRCMDGTVSMTDTSERRRYDADLL